jgi:hypothetical protein
MSKSIYNNVKIIYDDNLKTYGIMNIMDIKMWHTIATTKDLESAVAIKKAYCDGYYDGQHNLEVLKEC